MDYDKMLDDMREQLNQLAKAQLSMIHAGDTTASSNLQQSYDALKESFEQIRDGELQQDNADVVRQLENGADQIVVTGQSMYLNLLTIERSLQDGQRGLAALERSLQEARLRRDLGQTSDWAVTELERKREEMVSQLYTLERTISTTKCQLQLLMGDAPTGELQLDALPELDGTEFSTLNYETDLAAAKEASWTLCSAAITLADAQEEWEDTKKDYHSQTYQWAMAEHTWNAAQITYQSAVQEFEASFRALYTSIEDAQQVLENATSAAEHQKARLVLVQAQYRLGLTSYFELLTAQEQVDDANSSQAAAQQALFTALHQYRTAVEYGILA
jgi:outer membrane protein TolC